MRKTMMCAAVLCATAGAAVLYAVPAGAVQPSAPLALKGADTQNVETVRSRHRYRYHSRWYGAAGAYAGAYAYAPRYRSYGYSRRCTGDSDFDSAYPSWMCFNAPK